MNLCASSQWEMVHWLFVVTKLAHAYYRMGDRASKKHQVSSIAFLCRVLCFIQVEKNSLCRVNLSVPDGLHRQ